ncbi:MAG: transglycosylase SLT domain-containing protein [Actinomycetaceae bacterium]|nr:transglycosylase SLT domain-containing protein [Actinomycetaceae bacterium]
MPRTTHKEVLALIATIVIAATPSVSTAAQGKKQQYAPATISCVIDAAQAYKIPPALMLAVASVEGGKNGTASRNTNGTYDLGHFQLNTTHWRKGGFFSDYDMQRARWDGCLNAHMASRLMRWQFDNRGGRDWWTAAASYHSTTPRHNARYKKILIAKTREWERWLANVSAACSRRIDKTRPCHIAYAAPVRKTVKR